jgi:Bacteriophage HK97-gp10, putative tail-component
MADFSEEVTRWVNDAGVLASAVFRAIAYDTVQRVQELTPVDTGFLRSNWTVIKKGDAEPVVGRVPPPSATLGEAVVGDVLVIINPVIYARRIEYGFVGEDSRGRYYNQPGRHMVAQTMSELPTIAEAAKARVLSGSPPRTT